MILSWFTQTFPPTLRDIDAVTFNSEVERMSPRMKTKRIEKICSINISILRLTEYKCLLNISVK